MKKLSTFVAAAAAALFSVGAQALVIDDFSDSDVFIATTGAVGSVATQTTLGSMIGGERDIRIEKLAVPVAQAPFVSGSGQVTASVEGGRLVYGQSGSAFGMATISWDGIDGDANTLNKTGLGNKDLTDGGSQFGFRFTAFSDGGNVPLSPDAEVRITIWGGDGLESAVYTLNTFNTVTDITEDILFNDIDWVKSGGFTFADVGAIEIVINVNGDNGSLDVELDLIQTRIPEPSSLLLAGLALTGLGAAARRRRAK